jgi:hypothetical protein
LLSFTFTMPSELALAVSKLAERVILIGKIVIVPGGVLGIFWVALQIFDRLRRERAKTRQANAEQVEGIHLLAAEQLKAAQDSEEETVLLCFSRRANQPLIREDIVSLCGTIDPLLSREKILAAVDRLERVRKLRFQNGVYLVV